LVGLYVRSLQLREPYPPPHQTHKTYQAGGGARGRGVAVGQGDGRGGHRGVPTAAAAAARPGHVSELAAGGAQPPGGGGILRRGNLLPKGLRGGHLASGWGVILDRKKGPGRGMPARRGGPRSSGTPSLRGRRNGVGSWPGHPASPPSHCGPFQPGSWGVTEASGVASARRR